MKAHSRSGSARETVAQNGGNASAASLSRILRFARASQHISQRDASAQGHLVKVERQSVRNFVLLLLLARRSCCSLRSSPGASIDAFTPCYYAFRFVFN